MDLQRADAEAAVQTMNSYSAGKGKWVWGTQEGRERLRRRIDKMVYAGHKFVALTGHVCV